jgi:hypothetical protein
MTAQLHFLTMSDVSRRPLHAIDHIARTAFNFTKSDYKTIVFPVVRTLVIIGPRI